MIGHSPPLITVRGVTADHVLEVAIAPEGALGRISGAINRRPRRMFGLFKMENEYIGFVHDEAFEVWERRQRAVHVRGQVRGRRGGTRIELSFVLPTRTKVLIVVFFVLYILAAAGIALRPPDTLVTLEEILIAAGGAGICAFVFLVGARQQRADLRTFFERLFVDLPRI